MGVIGLTDVARTFPRIGALRKGGEKQKRKNAKGYEYETWGEDLDHFRFTSEYPEVQQNFDDAYGPEPRTIRVFLPYKTTDENFPVWRKEYSAGGLVHMCDGRHIIRHRVGSSIVNVEGQGIPCPYKSDTNPDGKIEPTAKNPGCTLNARLNVIIPDLGKFGCVEVHTSAINDVVRIDAQLRALEDTRAVVGQTLQGVPFALTRVEEMISSPNGDGRARRPKWMVHLVEQKAWSEMLLAAVQNQSIPQITASRPALVSGSNSPIDFETGEIVDFDGYDYEENEPPFVPDEPEQPEPAVKQSSPPPANPDVAILISDLQDKAKKSDKPASEKQVPLMMQTLGALCDSEKMKRSIMMYIFNIASGNDATSGMASAIIEWGGLPTNNWKPLPESISQAQAIYTAAKIHEGQLALL